MIDTSNYDNDTDYINALIELDEEFPLVKVLNFIVVGTNIPYGPLLEDNRFSNTARDIANFRNKRKFA